MNLTSLRPFLRSLFFALTGALGAVSAQAQTTACPATCDGSATIVRHGGETDRYWQLEAQTAGSTYTWQCVEPCPDDPFTEFDGLSTPTERVTQVNRMLERTYQVIIDSERGAGRCACVDVTPYEGSFPFLAIADPQFGVLQPKQHPFLFESRQLDRAIDVANRQQVAFVAVLGDMVNSHNNADQLAAYEDRMARLDKSIPLIEVPGNHDVNNKPTLTTLTNYRNLRGADYYSFSYANSRFFVINSTLLDVRRHMSTPYWETHGPAIDSENIDHRNWLTTTLPAISGEHHRIVLSHHPLFKTSPDEPYQASRNLDFEARNYLLGKLRDHQVTAVFAGHHHNHRGASAFDDPPNCDPCDPFEMITSARVSHTPSTAGFRLVNVFDDRIEHEFFSIDLPPTLIARRSLWRFNDSSDRAPLPNGGKLWFEPGYSISGWTLAEAPIGDLSALPGSAVDCGPDDPEACGVTTQVGTSVGTNPCFPGVAGETRTTTYFRQGFEVQDPMAFAAYTLELLANDGAVVYLNGALLWQTHMPDTTADHCTLALPDFGAPGLYASFEILPSDLQAGSNLLAIEVHRRDAQTDDMVFDLALTGSNPN